MVPVPAWWQMSGLRVKLLKIFLTSSRTGVSAGLVHSPFAGNASSIGNLMKGYCIEVSFALYNSDALSYALFVQRLQSMS